MGTNACPTNATEGWLKVYDFGKDTSGGAGLHAQIAQGAEISTDIGAKKALRSSTLLIQRKFKM